MIDEIYDASKEDTLLTMVGELYSARMLPSLLVHAVYSLVFIVPAIYCAIKFFDRFQEFLLEVDIIQPTFMNINQEYVSGDHLKD